MSDTPMDNKNSPGDKTNNIDNILNQGKFEQDIPQESSLVGSLFNKNTSLSTADAAIKMSHSPSLLGTNHSQNQDITNLNNVETLSLKDNNTTVFSPFQRNYGKSDSSNHTSLNKNVLPITPDSNNSSPNDIQINRTNPKIRGHSSLNQSLTSSPERESPVEIDIDGEYVCHYCDARFKMRGYLTRHIKKHALEKAYHCPFFNTDINKEDRCHATGGFSRRDTYKTHMKARHFTYPDGVKPADRNKYGGHCNACNEYFSSANVWIKEHIENGQCKGLPKEYLEQLPSQDSKQKITNRLKMIKTSTGHARYISTMESVVEPNVLLNKEALEAMVIVAKNTNRNDVLSKFGDDKLILNSDNFKGYKRPKRKYKKRTPKIKSSESSATPVDMTQSSVVSSTVETPNIDSPINTPQTFAETSSSFNYKENHSLEYHNTHFNKNNNNNNNNTMHIDEQQHQHQHQPDNHTNFNKDGMNNDYQTDNISIEISPKQIVEDQGLNSEPIPLESYAYPSAVMQQSENHYHNSNINNKFEVFPLDSEQQSYFVDVNEDDQLHEINDKISINKTLDEQYIPEKINQTQLEETREYLKFYNDFFGSGV
ncbi:similar to Saccharomyces cerevisiae YHR006W STP2 Transcription factor, activated by proteolytic processing in response to signals from the SPS sensor system for external amino acids [Maudiozyma saulgeensis]|uniref:Transcription factor STP1 n=1 Tax=Maudiozyma saulgeensis TaxID=1789683 RepID=A0A1X7QWX8_9SACH|nr:similar to Saccharomyces cerevisiae YHR006W STP2 Transcription factor, activated by proteolytic processing in response to signals from the SPS sensor system for external amino acids [Kazachstania saulgeensis]